MNPDEMWHKAIDKTEIFRGRIRHLHTFTHTTLPYIFLAESILNAGDVVVRQGRVTVEKPVILMPGNFPQLEGFQIDERDLHLNNDAIATFLVMRGISFPTMKYSNETHRLDVVPGPLSKAIKQHKSQLERQEDVNTGLIISPEDCWQFAILIYVCALSAKSIPEDIKNILRRMDIENN